MNSGKHTELNTCVFKVCCYFIYNTCCLDALVAADEGFITAEFFDFPAKYRYSAAADNNGTTGVELMKTHILYLQQKFIIYVEIIA